ncbi:MAG: ATP-binding protein, partial [Thaumarchaeota archaeon]|nr:ATP-binding protein [Nitrososphaerota archaeon]
SGPRQVGKTTMLKILVNRILSGETTAEATDPRSVFYLSCDELTDYKELGEVLDSYLRVRDSAGIKSAYIFLDEITFVDDWWRAVKSRIDDGALSNDVTTVTGSVSLDLLRQKEHFPGRRGKGRDVVLRPLGFHSYVDSLASGMESRATISALRDTDDVIAANRVHEETLGSLFASYASTGGFPLAIREKEESGSLSEESSKKALIDGLRGDWLRVGRSERFMKEVIAYIISSRGTPISWLGISKETSIGSPNTARAYVETLEDLLLVTLLELILPDGRVMHRKNRKIHFGDPFVYSVLARYAGVAPDEAAKVEGTVASHLARGRSTYYWRNGSEVDIVALEEARKWQYGFEVKWGFKKGVKPRHLKRYTSLNRQSIPIFLASLPFA